MKNKKYTRIVVIGESEVGFVQISFKLGEVRMDVSFGKKKRSQKNVK